MTDETPIPSSEEMLDKHQVAAMVGVRWDTLKRWRRDGRGPAFYRIGGRIRYQRGDVERWLSAQRREPGGER